MAQTDVKDLPLAQFLDRLASSDPTPGGGTASAIAGAVAAGLIAMVSRLSTGKGGDDTAFERMLASAEEERRALLDLATQDAEAFNAVMRAMRLPKGTAEEKQRRLGAIQDALVHAADVPLDVALRAVRLLEVSGDLAGRGNPNAISDVGVAALLAHSAVQGALLNVRINLQAINDPAYKTRAAERVRTLGLRAEVLRDEALVAVDKRLR